ncbi:unnamed protein product (macronuclear) [Paramecium tetraurelia]|uniref:PCI domain-containing protein n=1 Tax=Paramecium tetraurelia TaxID=5888 RepID=A0E5J2_PARTE|nr:uncharacterized protein GSPATT00003420001 [Paramecium tetraurelia]CAK90559.1 unnamed protein product [Paramecium tetraurelia]|eukprot:XP_001457956.1 hypothetical protein (macronuclear) [Paramecium tetraurelia strain d4-2]
MQSDIILNNAVIKLIREFQDKTIYFKYFVQYEKPTYQRKLYDFWVSTIDKLTENILKTSLINVHELQNLFSLFEYKPQCIENVLAQMRKEGKIVMEGYRTKAVNILLKVENEENEDLTTNNTQRLQILWNPLKKVFEKLLIKIKSPTPTKCPYFFHIKYFKENIIKFKQAVEEVSINQFNTFTAKQLTKVIDLPQREILFLISIFLEAKLIQSVGYFTIDSIKQEVFIYKSMWLVENNNLDLAKNQTLFQLKYQEILNSDEREECYKSIELKEKQIRKKILEKKSPNEIKFHIAEKLQFEKWIENYEHRLLIMQQSQARLRNADSDLQIQDIIFNHILKNNEIDNLTLQENLNEFMDHRQQQEETLQIMKRYEPSEIDTLYNKYLEENQQMDANSLQKQNTHNTPFVPLQPQNHNYELEERILELQQ